jgi:two-component system chemotaxis sensor kinase CheA
MIKGTPVFRLRDRLLPLVSLSDLLKISGAPPLLTRKDRAKARSEQEAAKANGSAASAGGDAGAEGDGLLSRNQYVVVTQVGAYDFGIIVDRVFDTEEIVVKPVAKILRDISLFSGNTILGDGTVIMILDPNGIARETGEIETTDSMDAAQADSIIDSSRPKTSLLLFSAGKGAPKAVPLSLVARLENVRSSSIEYSSGQMMVQYRGQLMPLVAFDSSVRIEGEDEKPVLVFTDKDRSMGLVVDEIIDITEEYIDVQLDGDQPGLLGSAIINEKATDVVDVAYFLHGTNSNWFKDHNDEPFSSAKKGSANGHAVRQRVLLVDDSPFFRNMLTPLLNVAGYDVTTLESPIDALKMCEKGDVFDVIISDIEMPDMDGFEFARKVKADSNWQDTPMVALSSHATPQDISRGIEVGYSKYVAKFDRDTLLNTISQTLSEHQQSQGAAS